MHHNAMQSWKLSNMVFMMLINQHTSVLLLTGSMYRC